MEQARHRQAEHDGNCDKNVFVLGHTGNMPAGVGEYNLGLADQQLVSNRAPLFGKARAPLYAIQRMQIFEFVLVMASLVLAIGFTARRWRIAKLRALSPSPPTPKLRVEILATLAEEEAFAVDFLEPIILTAHGCHKL